MANANEARRAKVVLKERLGRAPWLRGIGIGGEPGNYCVKVNVDALTEEVRVAVPLMVEGVRVVVDPVGSIRPFGG